MQAAVVVQVASPEHAAQIADMSREYIEYGLGWWWTERRVLKEIRNPETNVVVVAPDLQVRGFGIMSYGDDHAHLLLLAVLPQYRRQGIASAVVKWLEASARAAGSERIQVECRRSNAPARNLYLDHGYHEKVIESAMYRQSEDGIRLEKWVRAQGGKSAA
jgi:ribosomal-protein-alanine N-acetyltransferase